MNKYYKTFLMVVLSTSATVLFLLFTKNAFKIEPVQKKFFSGMLVYGQKSHCGLVKITMMDSTSCKLPDDFCTEYKDALNLRMRIWALQEKCSDKSEMRCSESGDFYDENFAGTQCYVRPQLVKILGK